MNKTLDMVNINGKVQIPKGHRRCRNGNWVDFYARECWDHWQPSNTWKYGDPEAPRAWKREDLIQIHVIRKPHLSQPTKKGNPS